MADRIVLQTYEYQHKLTRTEMSLTRDKFTLAVRVVDLGNGAIALLRQHRRSDQEKKLRLGPGATCGQDDATIFTNREGRAMDAGGLKRT